MVEKNQEEKLFNDANNMYGEYYRNNSEIIKTLLKFLKSSYSPIILWGAGLKGRSFLDNYDRNKEFIDFVIDMDIAKQGTELLTGHKVIDIGSLKQENSVIIVVNVNYYSSICFSLINNGYDIKKLRIICIDHYIDGKFNIDDVKNNTIWERKRYYD